MTRGRHMRRAGRMSAVAVLAAALGFSSGGASSPAPAVAAIRAVPEAITAAADVVDGRSTATAAASCWEIKQRDPAATTGVYWLVTPTLVRPDQFYCDMTTDGGGWVLVGRGREGWREEYEGRGDAASVRASVSGPAAFAAQQLPSRTIDGLLNGARVDALADGIRLRRAKDVGGTSWQEVRLALTSRDRWAWTFRARHPANARFDGGPAVNGTSLSISGDSAFRHLNTDTMQSGKWVGSGFAYGSQVLGDASTGSYLWSVTSGKGSARPFTQVFLRPKQTLANLGWGGIPDTGLPASARPPLAQTQAQPTVWGVAGLASNGGQDSEMRTEVQDFAQVGDTVFAGGNFARVQKDAQGSGTVAQAYLAAFAVGSGELRTGFRPVFNNQIKALAALPGGRLAVGGEFTTVNGQPRSGFAVLNAVTGALDGSMPLSVTNGLTGGLLSVRSLKVQGQWLYLGGAFTHLRDAVSTVYSRGAGRVSLGSGRADASWNPNLNGTVTEVTPSGDGTRVYLTGYFSTTNGVLARKVAALNAAPGAALIAWTPRYSVPATNENTFQFTVSEAASRVVVGGSEHSAFSYDKSTLAFRQGAISMAGGDFQTSVVDAAHDLVYAGCHCNDFLYSNTTTYPWPSRFDQGDKLGYVGAWDGATMSYRPEFNPVMSARRGYGAWSSLVDGNGVLWVGGSFSTSVAAQGRTQFSGGFARFAPRDSTPPPKPTGLTVTGTSAGVVARWSIVSEPGVTYEVLMGGRVVAVTSGPSASLPLPTAAARYAVRAVDAAGNRSATTPPASFDPASVPTEVTLVASDASWRWRWSSAPLPTDWTTAGFNDAAWSAGAAPLGFGAAGLATTLTPEQTTRPLAIQFRRAFNVANPTVLQDARLSVVANDGAIVYVNGVEVRRQNLPAGPITVGTYATASPREATAAANPMDVTLAPGVLRAGDNVIAVQTHLNYRSTPDASMHARAVATNAS